MKLFYFFFKYDKNTLFFHTNSLLDYLYLLRNYFYVEFLNDFSYIKILYNPIVNRFIHFNDISDDFLFSDPFLIKASSNIMKNHIGFRKDIFFRYNSRNYNGIFTTLDKKDFNDANSLDKLLKDISRNKRLNLIEKLSKKLDFSKFFDSLLKKKSSSIYYNNRVDFIERPSSSALNTDYYYKTDKQDKVFLFKRKNIKAILNYDYINQNTRFNNDFSKISNNYNINFKRKSKSLNVAPYIVITPIKPFFTKTINNRFYQINNFISFFNFLNNKKNTIINSKNVFLYNYNFLPYKFKLFFSNYNIKNTNKLNLNKLDFNDFILQEDLNNFFFKINKYKNKETIPNVKLFNNWKEISFRFYGMHYDWFKYLHKNNANDIGKRRYKLDPIMENPDNFAKIRMLKILGKKPTLFNIETTKTNSFLLQKTVLNNLEKLMISQINKQDIVSIYKTSYINNILYTNPFFFLLFIILIIVN